MFAIASPFLLRHLSSSADNYPVSSRGGKYQNIGSSTEVNPVMCAHRLLSWTWRCRGREHRRPLQSASYGVGLRRRVA